MNAGMKTIAFGTLLAATTLACADGQFLDVPNNDIPDAIKLSHSLNDVMEDASLCRQDNRELTSCLCEKTSIKRMSMTYENMIEKHPQWAGKTLRFHSEGTSHAIQLPTYKRELQRIQQQCG